MFLDPRIHRVQTITILVLVRKDMRMLKRRLLTFESSDRVWTWVAFFSQCRHGQAAGAPPTARRQTTRRVRVHLWASWALPPATRLSAVLAPGPPYLLQFILTTATSTLLFPATPTLCPAAPSFSALSCPTTESSVG